MGFFARLEKLRGVASNGSWKRLDARETVWTLVGASGRARVFFKTSQELARILVCSLQPALIRSDCSGHEQFAVAVVLAVAAVLTFDTISGSTKPNVLAC